MTRTARAFVADAPLAPTAPDPHLPMAWDQYAEGGTSAYLLRLGGHEIVILDTANFIERELAGLRPDIASANRAVSGRSARELELRERGLSRRHF